MKRTRALAAALLTLTVIAGCSRAFLDEFYIDSSGTFWGWPALGLEITNFEEWGESATQRLNGTVELFGVATVRVDGLSDHEVEAFAAVNPPERGNRRTLITRDLTTNVENIFHYELDDNAIVFGDQDGGVFAFSNADGTYDVVTARFDAPARDDELVRAEGFEVFHLIQAYNQFPADSPHALVLAASLGFGPQKVQDVRTMATCEVPNCPEGCGEAADGPLICQQFPHVCRCIMCLASTVDDPLCEPCSPE